MSIRLTLACSLTLAASLSAQAATVADLKPGHFVEIRGAGQQDKQFAAEKISLEQPDDEAALIGTISQSGRNPPQLLGYRLEFNEDTEFRGLTATDLAGQRVKAEGQLRDDGTFEVETLSERGPGRDRLEGAITDIVIADIDVDADTDVDIDKGSTDQSGWRILRILDHSIRLDAAMDLKFGNELSLSAYERVAPSDQFLARAQPDEDDRFGNGFALTDALRLTARMQAGSGREDNLNFDDTDQEDREDIGSGLRARLEWQPDSNWFGMTELRYNYQQREREDRPRETGGEFRLGETYIGRYLTEGTRLIIGRQDFDDDREFIFDENLDAIRINTTIGPVQLDASVSRMFDNDGSREEEADNLILYVSNKDRDRRLAAYWVYRSYADRFDEETYHVGIQAQGEWLPNGDLWLDLAHQGGRRNDNPVTAWAFDIGSLWYFDEDQRWYAMTGIAMATGDDPNTADDELFQQTGLADNNGRFGGVTSYRYYGEVADPDLSNLVITTLGLGHRLTESISLDVVAHEYRLQRLTEDELEGNWDSDLSGSSKRLGRGLDLVFGYSGKALWEVEGTFGYFSPGDGFEETDAGWIGNLQLRVRY